MGRNVVGLLGKASAKRGSFLFYTLTFAFAPFSYQFECFNL